MPEMNAQQKILLLEHIADTLLPSNNFEDNYLHIKQGKFIDPIWGPWIVQGFAKTYLKGTIPAMEVTIDCGYEQFINLKIIAQNPHKRNASGMLSRYAAMARKGSRICWVIDEDTNNFLGRVQDGEWIASSQQKPTTKPITLPPVNPHEVVKHVEQVMGVNEEITGIDDDAIVY
jgi:hypothetical protein